jgi:hypothetical protein
MDIFVYRITGVSPLLQNNPAAMGGKKQDGLAAKKIYIPEEEAKAALYTDDDGHIIIPSIAFRSAMFRAATGRKIGKSSAKTVISGSVFPVEQSLLVLNAKTGKPRKDYTIHKCRAVVNKAGILRCRPMISDWATDLALEIDTEMLPNPEVVTQLLNLAGKIAGVGDWRPEKLGVFGRFTAVLKS